LCNIHRHKEFLKENKNQDLLPPHAEAGEGEDDNDDGGHRGPDGHGHNLAVELALAAVVVAFAPEKSLKHL